MKFRHCLFMISSNNMERLYLYMTLKKIMDQYAKMTKSLRGVKQVKINYACKALSNITILKLLKDLGAGLDAVSYQEIRLGLQAGFQPPSRLFSPLIQCRFKNWKQRLP